MQAFPHRYFVSYALNPLGFGCTEISLAEPIRSIGDIKAISRLLGEQFGGNPIVLYFAALGPVPSTNTSE